MTTQNWYLTVLYFLVQNRFFKGILSILFWEIRYLFSTHCDKGQYDNIRDVVFHGCDYKPKNKSYFSQPKSFANLVELLEENPLGPMNLYSSNCLIPLPSYEKGTIAYCNHTSNVTISRYGQYLWLFTEIVLENRKHLTKIPYFWFFSQGAKVGFDLPNF